jgi:hypothetical protein
MKKILIVVAFGGLFACSKTDAPTGGNDPVFMVDFTFDSLKTIVAGKNGVYHFTDFTQEDSALFYSTNIFSNVNCPDGTCPGSLTFKFIDYGEHSESYFPGLYSYTLPDSFLQLHEPYEVNFNWKSNIEYPNKVLTLFTPNPVSFDNSANTATILLPNQTFQVLLSANDDNGLSSKVVRSFLPENPNLFPAVSILATPENDGYILHARALGPQQISTYLWSNGNDTDSIFVDSLNLGKEYTVTVTDAIANTASAGMRNLFAANGAERVTADFFVDAYPYLDYEQTETVLIQWVDEYGLDWRSDRGIQPPGFKFEVLENTSYEPNEKGDKTRKLRVQFQCMMFGPDGQQREMSGTGVIAMARP